MGKIRCTRHEALGVWIDRMLVGMRIEAAEDIHRPGPRYTMILLNFLRLSDSSRMLRSGVGSDIS